VRPAADVVGQPPPWPSCWPPGNLSTALSPGDLDDIAAAYATAFTLIRPA